MAVGSTALSTSMEVPVFDDLFISGFWGKVDQSGGPDACWPWLGGRMGATGDREGYGSVQVEPQKSRGAHRVAWAIDHNCDLPSPHDDVCHTCDNPPCCNPAHLWLDDAKGNAADMIRKRRHVHSRKDQCPRGHEFDRIGKRGDGRTFRFCSICARDASTRARRRAGMRIKRKGQHYEQPYQK